jgi:hypothetical protein
MNDVADLVAGFRANYSGNPAIHPWISADFDHFAEPFGFSMVRVGMNDVAILVAHFRSFVVPTDCMTNNPVSP